MRCLILIFLLFMGCEDDPVSTDIQDNLNPNQIIGNWELISQKIYPNDNCEGVADIYKDFPLTGPYINTYSSPVRMFLSDGIVVTYEKICDDFEMTNNCYYEYLDVIPDGWHSGGVVGYLYQVEQNTNSFSYFTLSMSSINISTDLVHIEFYSDNEENKMAWYRNSSTGVFQTEFCSKEIYKKIPEISIDFPDWVSGCTYIIGENYNAEANLTCYDCCGEKYGCIDTDACNFNYFADTDDGSCFYDECDFYSILHTDEWGNILGFQGSEENATNCTYTSEDNMVPIPLYIGYIYPNPFSTSTNIVLEVNTGMYISINIVDNNYNEVKVLHDNSVFNVNNYTITWDGLDSDDNLVPNGYYRVIFNYDSISETGECYYNIKKE